jgi:hypothetical protein
VSGAFLEVGAAGLALAGAILGAYGSYLLTRWYQFFRGWGFLESVSETLWLLVTCNKKKAIEKIKAQADFNLNEDDKATSLFGIHLILIGFGLQVIGAILAAADAIIKNLRPAS